MGDGQRKPRVPSERLRFFRKFAVAVLVAMTVVVVLLFRPANVVRSQSVPRPAANFEEAHDRIRKLWEAEARDVIPVCRTKALLNGKKTARVVVFVHGYTSCPEQFAQLADYFVRDSTNVLIVPLPYHGYSDRLSHAHGALTTEQLIAYGDEVVDIARGLGDTVVVAGLSAGGLIAGFVAQRRDDVYLAALISPVLGYTVVPHWLSLAAARFYTIWPEKFEWWDPVNKDQTSPAYSYPWYSRRALARMLYFGNALIADSKTVAPRASKILFVRNPNDNRISAEGIDALTANWERFGDRVSTYTFPADLKLGHDLIDPNVTNANVAAVYPKLHELLKGG